MFFLWVNKIKIKKINNNNFKFWLKSKLFWKVSSTVSLIKIITKTVIVENIDDTEEYLKINKTTTHVNINNKAKLKDRANKIPK